jgi:CBS domain-containing protein
LTCPACGRPYLSGEEVCENCGADLTATDTSETSLAAESPLLSRPLRMLGLQAPATIEGTVPVGGALTVMHDAGVDCLLVTEHGRLAGIFTERDAVLKLTDRRLTIGVVRRRVSRMLRHVRLGTRTLVGEVMTPDPVVLHPDESVAVAINKMAVGGFRHIPVVDGDRPVGVIAAKDVFRHVVELLPDA